MTPSSLTVGMTLATFRCRYLLVKRPLEVSIIVVSAPIWIPVLLAIMLIVKIAAPRKPAIFRQWRVGHHGKPFQILKIRTMVPNAEAQLPQLAQSNEVSGPQFKMRNDPRVTTVGRFLRKTHLDELPQLFNIVKGDMSLVGPRPSVAPLETYADWWHARLMCRPGLTGPWQVRSTANGSFDDRARLDIAYLRNRSIGLDLRILAKTVAVAFIQRNGA